MLLGKAVNTLQISILAALVASLSACGGSSSTGTATTVAPEGSTVQVSLLETTDLHSNVLSYNYYKLAADTTIGMERVATLIHKAQTENQNNVLLDDGDVIQGTPLADYQAIVSPVACNDTLAIHKVMNQLKYDAGTVGNHEFNFGLGYLSQVMNHDLGVAGVTKPGNCGGPNFPVVLANVNSVASNQPIFSPYQLIPKQFIAQSPNGGSVPVTLNVGVIGFAPPPIMDWDKKNLDGKVYVNGLKETATQYVPQMRAAGADLVVALSHGGLDASTYSPTMENGSWHLATVPGIDAMMIGHSHEIFPNAVNPAAIFKGLPNVDVAKGFVNGVPTVMAQSWGRRLGVIKITLKVINGKWVVQPALTTVETRGFAQPDGTTVAADPTVEPMVDSVHQATIAYAQQPLGTTDFNMASYFSRIGDVSAIQIDNQMQQDYVARYIATNLPQYANIPVLSASAPFKYGRNGASDYTDVAAGTLQVRSAGDLYVFDNTIQAVKLKGSDLRVWLETAAKQFKQIDPTQTAAQSLFDPTFAGYNFDVLYGANNALQYQIDVTKPVGSRIVGLTYQGQPVTDTMDFIVATNNYRASGGGNFPGLDGSKTILKAPDANRDVLSAYIKKVGALTYAANGSGRSWRFAKVTTNGPVTFTSGANKLNVAAAEGFTNVSEVQDNGDGTWLYAIDLSK